MSISKKSYFQGGGGVNEPTPGQKKYKSDPAIVVQPRFEEPFYRNYDLYDVPGKYGPGSGWHEVMKHPSIKEFLEFRRKRLQGKYVADDSWILDNGKKTKENPEMKARAAIFAEIVKIAADENDGPNFDYGSGLYSNMNKYKSVKDFEEHADKGPGAFFADDNADYMLPPKEHGTHIYDWKNSPYQGKPKIPKQLKKNIHKSDDNDIDFPVDDMVNHQDQMIYPIEDEYEIRREKGDRYVFPSDGSSLGPENLNISMTSPQIAGEHSYLPEDDFDGKNPYTLNFSQDYTENAEFPDNLSEEDLQKLMNKYLSPSESDLFGLPDGIDPNSDLDAEETINDENPDWGTPDTGEQMYEDKWNI